MRLDKYLKVSRIIKRRTVAKEVCESERVSINGKKAKPSTVIKEGDIIEIQFFMKPGIQILVYKNKKTERKDLFHGSSRSQKQKES